MTTTELKKLKEPSKTEIQGFGMCEFYTPEQVVEILVLLGVNGSLKMRVEQMEFIPEEPYLSDVISWEKGNIWELHELFPETKNIEIKVNKNYR